MTVLPLMLNDGPLSRSLGVYAPGPGDADSGLRNGEREPNEKDGPPSFVATLYAPGPGASLGSSGRFVRTPKLLAGDRGRV